MDWIDTLAAIARHAGRVALRHYRTDLTVEVKPDGSPVTAADRQAEQAAREWIERYFPDDRVTGEEGGETGSPRAARRWVIDPIDGTQSFIRGVPFWGTMVGVMHGSDVVAGAVYCPAIEELVVAAAAAGCWFNGARCHVSAVSDLSAATVLATDDRFRNRPERQQRWIALAQRAAIARTWGDCYGYLLVATGRADVMVDNALSIWDFAPLVPIIREAAGVITDWQGRTAFGGDAIATNAALAEEVRAMLRDRETA